MTITEISRTFINNPKVNWIIHYLSILYKGTQRMFLPISRMSPLLAIEPSATSHDDDAIIVQTERSNSRLDHIVYVNCDTKLLYLSG